MPQDLREPAPRSSATVVLLLTGWCLALAGGCGTATPLTQARVEVRPPGGWTPAPADRWPVPGTPLAAWSGPGGASFVVHRTLPIPGGTAEQFGKALETRLTNLPELRVLRRDTTTIAGRDASRLEVVASGTGDRLAPSGAGKPYAPEGTTLAPTRRVVVAIPRAGDTLVLVWHALESEADALGEAVQATLATLRLSAQDAATRAY